MIYLDDVTGPSTARVRGELEGTRVCRAPLRVVAQLEKGDCSCGLKRVAGPSTARVRGELEGTRVFRAPLRVVTLFEGWQVVSS